MRIFIFGFLLVLSACTSQQAKEDRAAVEAQVKEDANYVADQTKANAELVANNATTHTMRIANNVRDSVKRTNRKVRDWWLMPLPPEPQDQAVPSSYCYAVLQDVLCYRQPMPGWEHRLTGYQGTAAEPPPPALTTPLPVAIMDGRKEMDKRVADAKPVFVDMPAGEKKDATEVVPTSGDATNQALPNPLLSPQL